MSRTELLPRQNPRAKFVAVFADWFRRHKFDGFACKIDINDAIYAVKTMRNTLLAPLAFLAVLVSSNHLCFAQTNPPVSSQTRQVKTAKLEKLKKQVENIGVGGKITVIRLDGRDFYGKVSNIEGDSFQIEEIDLRQTLAFKYTEVKKIKTGDGEKNLITGRRVNPKKGWIYGIAILGALAVLLAVGLSDKDF